MATLTRRKTMTRRMSTRTSSSLREKRKKLWKEYIENQDII